MRAVERHSVGRAHAGIGRRRDELKLLTDKQLRCLSLAREHWTSKEIAAVLGISRHTVDQRMRVVLRKLGVRRRKEALRLVETVSESDAPTAREGEAGGNHQRMEIGAAAEGMTKVCTLLHLVAFWSIPATLTAASIVVLARFAADEMGGAWFGRCETPEVSMPVQPA